MKMRNKVLCRTTQSGIPAHPTTTMSRSHPGDKNLGTVWPIVNRHHGWSDHPWGLVLRGNHLTGDRKECEEDSAKF